MFGLDRGQSREAAPEADAMRGIAFYTHFLRVAYTVAGLPIAR
jgi:hypothetical protein